MCQMNISLIPQDSACRARIALKQHTDLAMPCVLLYEQCTVCIYMSHALCASMVQTQWLRTKINQYYEEHILTQ